MNKIYSLLALLILLCHLPGSAQMTTDSIIVITNVKVWDGLNDSLLSNYQVVIMGNHVSQVGSSITLPPGAKIIDGKGGTVIPGLSDAHLQLMLNVPAPYASNNINWAYATARAVKMAENFLMQGFTTIRDMGGPVYGIKQAIDEGTIPGPRIYPSGAMISQTSGHGGMRAPNELNPDWNGNNANQLQLMGWSCIANGRPEVLDAVRGNLRNGASQIKMMVGGDIASGNAPIHCIQFTKDELIAGVEAAQDWGTYVSVHAYTPEAIRRALEAGVKSIEHGQLIDDTTMQLIKAKGAFLVPQSYLVNRDASTSDTPAKCRQVQAGAANEMDLAKKHGVKLAFGSDVSCKPGIEPQALQEFASRVKWFTPVQVLKQATSQNAELFALSGKLNPYPNGELGVVRPGAYADLLIYEGNPLQDIQVIVNPQKNLKLIMKDGKIYKNELK